MERGHRRTGNKENRHSVHYDGEMEKQKERSTKISSRSKSHHIGEERKSTDKERSHRRQYEEREGIDVKGKGEMKMWFVSIR